MEAVDTMADTPIIAAKEDAVRSVDTIGVVAKAVGSTVILHTTVGLLECAIIQSNTEGPQKKTTRRTRCDATRCRGAI